MRRPRSWAPRALGRPGHGSEQFHLCGLSMPGQAAGGGGEGDTMRLVGRLCDLGGAMCPGSPALRPLMSPQDLTGHLAAGTSDVGCPPWSLPSPLPFSRSRQEQEGRAGAEGGQVWPNADPYWWPQFHSSFPGGASGKEPPANAGDIGDLGLIPGSGRPSGGGHGNPTPVLLPGESHGQRSLAGHSPRGRKESDTTERLAHTR